MIKINKVDDIFPDKLRKISNPPEQLYLDGNINLLNSKCISIIGSRNCSENGQKIAKKFATELSTSGLTIVSGLAKGIDTVAHTFSYLNPGKTIAVLGCGLNNIFPEENIELAKKIVENNGLIISEYPPNEEAKSKYFIERNRIVSALSLGILVVEAFSRSGTSATAKFAREQQREVFSVPHEIWDSRGVGTNMLIKNGAKLVTDTSDILSALNLNKLRKYYLDLKSTGIFDEFSTKPNYYISNKKSSTLKNNSVSPVFTNFKEEKIYNLIKEYPCTSQNDLLLKTSYSINEILSILFMLEVEGYIKKVQGGYTCM